jgi:hypothetical protein
LFSSLRNGLFGVPGAEASSPRSRLFHLRFALLILEQPVEDVIKVYVSITPVMPIWIVAIGVIAIGVIAIGVIAIRLVAIRVVDVRIRINVLPLNPLRVGWNGARH